MSNIDLSDYEEGDFIEVTLLVQKGSMGGMSTVPGPDGGSPMHLSHQVLDAAVLVEPGVKPAPPRLNSLDSLEPGELFVDDELWLYRLDWDRCPVVVCGYDRAWAEEHAAVTFPIRRVPQELVGQLGNVVDRIIEGVGE